MIKSVRDERAQYDKGTGPPRRREQLADDLIPSMSGRTCRVAAMMPTGRCCSQARSGSDEDRGASVAPLRSRAWWRPVAMRGCPDMSGYWRRDGERGVAEATAAVYGWFKGHWLRQACCCLLVRGLDEPEVLRRFGDELRPAAHAHAERGGRAVRLVRRRLPADRRGRPG
jgi:hypothetical protein